MLASVKYTFFTVSCHTAYLAQDTIQKKNSDLAQIPSKIKKPNLAHSNLAQIPRKKKIAPGPQRYQETKVEVSQLKLKQARNRLLI